MCCHVCFISAKINIYYLFWFIFKPSNCISHHALLGCLLKMQLKRNLNHSRPNLIHFVMSYLRYLCLLAHSGVQHILCCVFVLFFFVLCTLLPVSVDCPFFIAPSYSLTFICPFLWIVHSSSVDAEPQLFMVLFFLKMWRTIELRISGLGHLFWTSKHFLSLAQIENWQPKFFNNIFLCC